MKTLYLSTNEKKADEVKDFMLDYMWSQVQIKYTDENCYLILEDETRIEKQNSYDDSNDKKNYFVGFSIHSFYVAK